MCKMWADAGCPERGNGGVAARADSGTCTTNGPPSESSPYFTSFLIYSHPRQPDRDSIFASYLGRLICIAIGFDEMILGLERTEGTKRFRAFFVVERSLDRNLEPDQRECTRQIKS
jgi:hypothetical protein